MEKCLILGDSSERTIIFYYIFYGSAIFVPWDATRVKPALKSLNLNAGFIRGQYDI